MRRRGHSPKLSPLEETLGARTSARQRSSLRGLHGANLGPPLDIFVGRASDLAELERLLAEGARLVTVKGTGGAGKTRVSRQLARRAAEELSGGAWFVDLTEARSLVGVLHATAVALGVPLGSGDDVDGLVAKVGHAIAGRGPMLLVLDNFEQVVKHAPATVGRWMERAPEARFLATSRESLRLAGEHIFRLKPLPEEEGVALFELRASAAGVPWEEDESTRSAVTRIVQELDGLPLAIELAAARSGLLSPTQILDRLSERFKLLRGGKTGDSNRQASLRGLIDWSWELLEPWEQAALAQLSVFRGGFVMEAAEEVLELSAWPDAPWSMDVIGSLLDKSLLHSREVLGQPRFGMYVSIHAYAAEKLVTENPPLSGSDAECSTRMRHARFYARYGSEAFIDSLDTHGGVERLRGLALELENLLAGVKTGEVLGEPEAAAGCALGASTLFQMHGPFSEGVALLARVAALPFSRATRAFVVRKTGILSRLTGRMSEAHECFLEVLSMFREMGNRRQVGATLLSLATLHRELDHVAEAHEFYQQTLAITREVGDRRNEGAALGNLAILHVNQGRISEAREHYQQALAIAREVGSWSHEGINLGNLALLEHHQGRISEALKQYLQALSIHRETGNLRHEGVILGHMATLYRDQNRITEAQEHFDQSLAIARELGDRRNEGVILGNIALVHLDHGRIAEALEDYQQALAIAREVGHRRTEAANLGNLGDLLYDQGELTAAKAHLRQAIAIGEEVWPVSAGAFRGSLALICAEEGAIEEARTLLAKGEAQLRGVWKLELGKLLCKKARVEHLAGDSDAAATAIAQAESIASDCHAGPDSELGSAIDRAREHIAPHQLPSRGAPVHKEPGQE